MRGKRNYKDSLFRSIFNNKKNLLSLYNAIEGTNYTDTKEIKITTLKGTFFNDLKNDISFKIGEQYIILIEHQSTINENMPLRCLFYISRLYQSQVNDELVYRGRIITLPTPKFYVFYNGEAAEQPERVMKLSEAFADEGGRLELLVKAYNINSGNNSELLEKCRALKEYSIFVSMVREKVHAGIELSRAIKETIRYCRENNVLSELLATKAEEVYDMVSVEWDMEKAKRIWKEEGVEEGIIRTAVEMLKLKLDLDTIAEVTKLSIDRIKELGRINKLL